MPRFYLQRVYDSPQKGGDYRVLVDRLWPRGLTQRAARIDWWPQEIAPSPQLRRWFKHDPRKWSEFQRRYREELEGVPGLVAQLIEKARERPVTLVFAAKDRRYNNAVVLQEYLEERAADRNAQTN